VLADRLGLHLENARLFGQLRDTIATLHVERSMRERFVATLAHDLRGPLSAARLAAELIAREPARAQDLAIRVERNVERVDRMIRDLLDANRIRAGEPLPLRLEVCDLCALAHQVAEEARAMYGDRFAVDCGEARGIWSADELHRALWNLVSNAVKYGAPKQPITISVTTMSDDGVRASVHNLGEPLPADELPSLFDAFYRSPKARAGGNLGWGLGLALVRGCAEAHGGHARVSSDQTGTTFSIELPLDATPYQRGTASPSELTVH
jgi:signal transduction histidine kinase